MLVNDALDLYERECLPALQPRSRRDYKGIIVILRATFGHMEMRDVKPRHVYEFINVPTGRIHRNRMVTILSTIFNKAMGRWCLDDDLTNPCKVVERWPTSPRDRYVTDAELQAFRATCCPQLQIAIDLAVLLGQRQGDLVALTWEQVRTVGIPSDQWHIKFRQSKTGKRLAVRLSLAVERVLDRAWLSQSAPHVFVICHHDGSRYTDDGFRSMWQRAMRAWAAAGHERFHFHDLRAKAGSDSKDVNAAFKLLGHQNMSMTQRVYERGERIVEPSA